MGSMVIVVFGSWLYYLQFGTQEIQSWNLCKQWQYQVQQVSSLLVCMFFGVAFLQIRKGILTYPRVTQLDQIVLKF